MSKEEQKPNIYQIPKNSFDTGYVLNGQFKTRNFVEGIILALPFLGIFIYGWHDLGWDVQSTVAYCAILCAAAFLGAAHGVGGDSLFEFIQRVIRFRQSRRISKYNPRIKTELEPEYLIHDGRMLPKDKLKQMLGTVKGKVLGEENGPISSDITDEELKVFYDDDYGFLEKPDALNGVDSIQHKQLAIALSDIPYQCVTKALRAAKKHGYVEVFMRDESRYVRISPDGLKYIRSTQKDALDVDKRAAMKRRIKGEQGRLTRVETTLCMCRAAGIQPAKEAGIKLIDMLDPEQDATQTFMNDFFYDKGLLFLSDEISATIKASSTMGEEYTLGQSRLVGIVINRTGISFLYCTLDKLMRWVVSYEQRRVSAVMELLKSSSLAATDEDFATICNMSPKCIVIGKTCAIVPKIITGDKYGKAIDSTDIIKTHNATRLLTLTNLEQVYKYSYFVPTSSIGVELLTRTAALTRNELNEMISVWLDEMAESHTTVTTGRYVEAYINEQKCKTITLPVIEFEELEYQKNGRVPYHVVCERGMQDGISRALGSKVLDFKDFDNIPMPAHKYDDDGIRRDGINPLTHNGYNEEEMDDQ